MRSGAIKQLTEARNTLKNAAHECASGVRAGCAGAPEKRNWFESGLAFVGGVLGGAGEALWDLGEMAWNLSPQGMLINDLTSGMTAEELAAKHRMQGETALAMLQAMKDDPVGFGKNLGKALLDWDTWSDDPARAIGHLVPDLVAAIATGGAGAAVTRGGSALGAIGRHSDDIVDGMIDAEHTLEGVDDLGDLGKLDDVGDPLRHIPDDQLTNKQLAERYGIDNPSAGMTVYRVFGEAHDNLGGLERGSRPFGESWTPADPRKSTDFRWEAGLPDENPSRFIVEGILRRPSAVDGIHPALTLDGNPGGWPEYLIKDAERAVEMRHVGGINETWSHRPGDWTP